ncbi:hypothetical protein C427_2546 [Paraglaciecola psychrophila 170]|uniref:Uncharacterized protein n=1 Tax=Paraglaciecola psychrophila 170 TaxID=1129794 RepID=M4RLZ6_9ALTE|nr:hypothetical protein C427_2546 [Paraglaciecola psychrophila 170]
MIIYSIYKKRSFLLTPISQASAIVPAFKVSAQKGYFRGKWQADAARDAT